MSLDEDQQQNDHPRGGPQPAPDWSNKGGSPVDNTAPRLKRFTAAMVDGFLGLMVSIPIFDHYNVWDALRNNADLSMDVTVKMTLYGLLMFFMLHGVFLYKFGQTLGKRIVGIAIVMLDGQKPNFQHLILNRYVPLWVSGFVPVIGPVLELLDVLFIFGKDRRCIHDLIAGTKVIDLSIKVETVPNSIIV